MAAFTRIESGIVINTAKPGRSLFDITQYIEAHVNDWVGKQVIWDLTLFDFSAYQQLDFSAYFAKFRQLAAKRSGLKTAIVVHCEDTFRKLQTFVSILEANLGIRLCVCKTLEDAQVWVGAEKPERA